MSDDLATALKDSIEQQLDSVRAQLLTARIYLKEARAPLEQAEREAREAWTRKNAASASLLMTARATAACGLTNSATAKAARDRIESRIEFETSAIRNIVESARPACQLFEWAWDQCTVARAAEINLLKRMQQAELEITNQQPAKVQTATSLALRASEQLQQKERAERRIDLALPDDPHYDPHYDDTELWERRNRPWV